MPSGTLSLLRELACLEQVMIEAKCCKNNQLTMFVGLQMGSMFNAHPCGAGFVGLLCAAVEPITQACGALWSMIGDNFDLQDYHLDRDVNINAHH